jgi:hypothetical protein
VPIVIGSLLELFGGEGSIRDGNGFLLVPGRVKDGGERTRGGSTLSWGRGGWCRVRGSGGIGVERRGGRMRSTLDLFLALLKGFRVLGGVGASHSFREFR